MARESVLKGSLNCAIFSPIKCPTRRLRRPSTCARLALGDPRHQQHRLVAVGAGRADPKQSCSGGRYLRRQGGSDQTAIDGSRWQRLVAFLQRRVTTLLLVPSRCGVVRTAFAALRPEMAHGLPFAQSAPGSSLQLSKSCLDRP